MATVDIYHRFGMPVIVWGAVLPDITYANDYQGNPPRQRHDDQPERGRGQIHDRPGLQEVGDHPRHHRLRQRPQQVLQRSTLKKDGGQILGTFGVTADQQDFTAELTKIKELKPDVIYFGGLTPLGVRIRSQMEKLGINAQFEGTSGIKSDAFIEGLGGRSPKARCPSSKARRGRSCRAACSSPASTRSRTTASRRKPTVRSPSPRRNLIMDAIEKVGPNRKKVTDELGKTKDRDSIIGKVTFDDHGQNIVPLITKYVVQDGKWVVWEDSEYATGKRKLKGQ